MTEIPEHLLKRSRERRAQLKGESADSGESASSGEEAPASTPAKPSAPAATSSGPATRAAAPEPATPPPPEPDPPVVAAAKSRRRVPFWAMAVLSLMPLWAFMYVRALTEGGEGPAGPLGAGAEVYNDCATCHGADGGGGTGRQLNNGAVLETFPEIEDQLRFVTLGSEEYAAAGIESYGDPQRDGGPHAPLGFNGTAMPPQGEAAGGALTDAEILAVVCHERYTIGGADPTSDAFAEEYERWCSETSPIYGALEAGEYSLADAHEAAVDSEGSSIDMIPIGEVPREGSPAGG